MNRTFALAILVALAPVYAANGDALSTKAPGSDRYQNLWINSPFLRPLNAAESYVLTGVARFDNKPMVTMLNTATSERITLTTEGNSLGWKLLDLTNDPDPRNITARVIVNGEEVAVRFNERQLSPESLLKASAGSPRALPFSTPRAPGSAPKEPRRKKDDSSAKPKTADPQKKKRRKASQQ